MSRAQADATDRLSVLIDFFEAEPDVLAVYLHGSRLKGEARTTSDLDIALLMENPDQPHPRKMMQWTGELTSMLGCEADIGILSTGNLVYAAQVIRHGRLLFSRNQSHSDMRIAHLLSLYAKLREDRREVEEAYRAA